MTVLAVSGLALSGPGQTPRDFAIDLQANVSTAAPPHITLSWSLRQAPKIMKQNLYRRLKGETNWNAQVSQPPFAVLGSNDTSFADFDALPGVEYEYWLQRTFSGLSPSPALGYLSAGAAVPMRESRGTLLLTVDDTVAEPLAPEIAQLRRDLTGDGWNVKTLIAQRAGSASQVKAQIQTAYGADPLNVKAVYLLGHVPVPYSGSISPDGHGDHNGAWPADSYYGDMNGTWTDTSVSNTTSSGTRNDNVPGDGKFDQSSLPSALELMVGRVDLHSMTKAPSAAATEIMLLRRYLRKAHDFRHKRNAYASIPRRGILRDGFGQFGSEAFAISGWSWIFTAVGTDVDTPLSNQWFLPEYAGGKDYLVGYGNGGGNYESASSVGSSTDFGIRTSRVVFTSLFGSYFGDWDANNDFLRAPLAGNATGDSLGLTCFWGGRPARFTHHTGMGETVGYSAMVSQNSTFWGSNNNYQPNSYSGVHPGLMGDPALRLHVTEPPRNLTAQSANSRIELRWDASTEVRFEGHLVYRAPSEAGPFTRLTADPLPVPAFTDTTVAAGSAYTYQVRTLALEQAPGGSYVNPSVGVFITLTANASASAPPRNPGSLGVTPVRSDSALLSWADLSEDETGFRIERQTDAAGTFVSLATVGPDVTTFHDPGPFAHGHTYRYRVAAVNAAGDSPFSEEAAFDAVAGHFDLPVTRAKVAKTAGGVQITVNRFGGANGAVTLNYATANTTAYAGTHYTAVNGTLSWADGEVGPQSITVPILETPEPNPARQFTLTVSGNSAGTGITANNRISVLIEDAAASLPSPWTASLVGSVTDYSSAVLIGETFHSVVIGGSGVTSGTTDNGRFIHQSRSGDGILTAFLPSGLPSDGNARVALMVRATTANNAIMAAAVASSSSSFGAKLAYRTTTGGSAYALPTSSNALLQPCWLRLTRTGPLFTAEASADGTDWIQLGTISAPAMPATALWGIFHLSSNNLNYHLASVENLTLADLPTPAAPQGLTATSPTPATVSLIWEAVPIASGYRIERRGEGGEFELLAEVTATATATQTYTDASCAADTAYAYRVTALNASGAGQPSETAVAVTPQPYIVTLHTTDDPGGADARIQRDRPDTPLGNDALLAVEGYFYYDDEVSWTTLTNASKTYLRFPLGELAGIATAQLKLRFVDSRFLDFYGNYDLFVALLNDSSDEWDENTITWRNAPQNYTNAYGFLPGFLSVGGYRKSTVPAPGESIAIDLEGETLFDNCGTNCLVTLVLYQFCAASTLWAAREHPDYAPPTLELATVNPLPRRTAFLTATRGLLWSVELTWQDGGATETGFELERSVNGGAFGLLQTLPAGTTAFTDDATQPDTHYTYRVRAINAAGASSWSPSVSATTPDFYHASGTVWDGGGAEPAFDEPANWDRDALPSFDGSAYLNFAVAGDEARVNQPIALYGLSLHHANPFALTDDGGLLTLGAAGLRAANPNPGGPLEYGVSARVALAADQTWTVTNNAGAGATSLTVSGPVS
ncbi:MAG: Calx-beta domain-containing protein, partial [Kiritimatiellia bacterium]|nr:Calx-beta domain-containing protein [Kiritimatiellia bacterium]